MNATAPKWPRSPTCWICRAGRPGPGPSSAAKIPTPAPNSPSPTSTDTASRCSSPTFPNPTLLTSRPSTGAGAAPGVDGGEFAALDLVQHGLTGHAEGLGGLVEGQPAVGGVLGDFGA